MKYISIQLVFGCHSSPYCLILSVFSMYVPLFFTEKSFFNSLIVTCGNPANVLNSTFTKTGVNEGDTATYTCEIGYAISGQSVNTATATCRSNGNWDGVPMCVGKTDYFHLMLVCTLLNYRVLGPSAC